MRILLAFQQDITSEPHLVPAYRFWRYYMRNGIAEAGMEMIEIPGADWAEGLIYPENSAELLAWRERTWQLTLDFVRNNRHKFDVFLTYLYPKQVDTNAISEIRKLGVPCVNFYCDHVRQYLKVPTEFKAFDLMWVPEYEATLMYRQAGVKYINLPMPMWLEPKYRNATIQESSTNVTFIGSKDFLRDELLGEAIAKGMDISVSGSGWLKSNEPTQRNERSTLSSKLANQVNFINQHGLQSYMVKTFGSGKKQSHYRIPADHISPRPSFEDYILATQSSKVTLGINRVSTYKSFNTQTQSYSRLRDIEAPMLGACYLTEYCDGLPHLYDLEKEVLVYHNVDELIYQSQRLLNDATKRRQLRIAGQKRALEAHSIPVTLQKIKAAILK